MQTRSSNGNSVRRSDSLSVRLSVKSVHDKTEKNQSIYLYHTKDHLVLREKELVGGATPPTWNFVSTGPVGAKSPVLNRYALVALIQPSHLA